MNVPACLTLCERILSAAAAQAPGHCRARFPVSNGAEPHASAALGRFRRIVLMQCDLRYATSAAVCLDQHCGSRILTSRKRMCVADLHTQNRLSENSRFEENMSAYKPFWPAKRFQVTHQLNIHRNSFELGLFARGQASRLCRKLFQNTTHLFVFW